MIPQEIKDKMIEKSKLAFPYFPKAEWETEDEQELHKKRMDSRRNYFIQNAEYGYELASEVIQERDKSILLLMDDVNALRERVEKLESDAKKKDEIIDNCKRFVSAFFEDAYDDFETYLKETEPD
jgi:hypothetical protein